MTESCKWPRYAQSTPTIDIPVESKEMRACSPASKCAQRVVGALKMHGSAAKCDATEGLRGSGGESIFLFSVDVL